MSNELGLQLNISVLDIKEVQAQMVTAKNKAPLAIQRAINRHHQAGEPRCRQGSKAKVYYQPAGSQKNPAPEKGNQKESERRGFFQR